MTIQTNTGTARRHQRSRFLLGLIVLVASWACLAPATQAQRTFDEGNVQRIVVLPPGADVEVVPLEDLTGTDLSGMSSKEWKALRKEHTRLLGSSDERVRERAMQNIIFFAHTYPDVDFTRAVSGLYKIYQRDEHENHRIMALSALSAIGNRNVMDLLREDVSQEQSERVRRYTLYALADFYKHYGGQ
jgi:hypothetical protein